MDNNNQDENILVWIAHAEFLCQSRGNDVSEKMKLHLDNSASFNDNESFSVDFFEGNLHARLFTKQFLITGISFIEPENSPQFGNIQRAIKSITASEYDLMILLQAFDNNDVLSVEPFSVASLMLDTLHVLNALTNELIKDNEYYAGLMSRVQFTLGYCDFCIKLQSNPIYKRVNS